MQLAINLLVIFLVYLTKVEFVNSNKHTIIPNNNQFYLNNAPSHQVSFDFQADLFDYWVKLLPNEKQKPECSIKKVSPEYLSTLKIIETLELQKSNLIRCEIVNKITERKPIITIHTSSTTSESPDVTKFSNPTDENCFSFRVKTKGVAEIYLYSDLNTFKHVVITLGTGNNTESSMRDIHGTCKDCKSIKTYKILNAYEHKGFWISVDKNTITVGDEDGKELFHNTFYNNFGEIRFIGVATSGNVDHGSWKIMEPFCPNSLKRPNKEYSYVTKCHKMFDKTFLRLSDLSLEDKLFKEVKALEEEYNTEIIEFRISKNRLSDYYITNLNGLYIDYMDVLRKCRKRQQQCNNLESIELKIDEFRKTLQNKIKELIESPYCSSNGKYEEALDKCVCNKGFAGNGFYCEKDSDGDKVPDKTIKECNGQLECKKDNCVNVFNPNQSDWNSDGTGDVCENQINNYYNYVNSNNIEPEQTTDIYPFVEDTPMNNDENIKNISPEEASDEYLSEEELPLNDQNKMNCAKLKLPDAKSGQICLLTSNFYVPFNYNQSKIEIIFSQTKSKMIYKLTWNNDEDPKFKINILKDLKENTDDFDLEMPKTNLKKLASALRNRKSKMFEKGANYNILLKYGSKLHLQVKNYKGEVIDTIIVPTNDIKADSRIAQLCTTSETIKWLDGGDHSCK